MLTIRKYQINGNRNKKVARNFANANANAYTKHNTMEKQYGRYGAQFPNAALFVDFGTLHIQKQSLCANSVERTLACLGYLNRRRPNNGPMKA